MYERRENIWMQRSVGHEVEHIGDRSRYVASSMVFRASRGLNQD